MGVAPGKNMSAKLKILLAAQFSMMLRPEKIAQADKCSSARTLASAKNNFKISHFLLA
jgi:hypothetical protein